MTAKLLQKLIYTIAPGTCIACGGPSYRRLDLCPGCQRDLNFPRHTCWQCGLELTGDSDSCQNCIAEPPLYSHCFSAFNYQPPLSHLIQRFKTQPDPTAGLVLGSLLAHRYCKKHSHYPDLWVPVPLHWTTERHRGFNQATELALILGKATDVPVAKTIVTKIRKTSDQKNLNRAARASNLSGAFHCQQDLTNLSIGIVDDVVTTGATASAICKALLSAGATDVEIACVARTPAN